MMPTRDPHDSEFNLVHGLDLDRFPDGASATSGPRAFHAEDPRMEAIRAAVALVRHEFSTLEELVYALRYEATPQWTHRKIAIAANLTRSRITQVESRVLTRIRVAVANQKGEGVEGA